MTKQITRQQLSAALVERHGQERQQHLYTASVGIAGLGGLGSNIAVQLTRLGIGHLTL
ncbi:ThiF family adenylyltransferase, partial [Phascolarctobacterium faecium]